MLRMTKKYTEELKQEAVAQVLSLPRLTLLLALKIIVAAGIAAIIAQRYLIGSCFGRVA